MIKSSVRLATLVKWRPMGSCMRRNGKSRCMTNIWRYSWSRQTHCCTVTGWGAVLVPHLFWTAPASQLPRFHKGATPAPVVCKYVCTRLEPPLTLKRQTPLQTFQIQEGLKWPMKAGLACMCFVGNLTHRERADPHYPPFTSPAESDWACGEQLWSPMTLPRKDYICMYAIQPYF